MGMRTRLFIRCLPSAFRAGLAAVAVTAIAAFGPAARAQTLIDPSESAGDVPTYAGTGLWGLYYDSGDGFSSANGDIPEMSFQTTNACYPDCLGNSFSDGNGGLIAFTNGNAFNFTNTNPDLGVRNTWDNSELDLTGYIAITKAGTYTFTIGSDDNTNLTIGGNLFQVFGGGPTNNSYTFTKAGLYPIDVQFFEMTGGSRLSLVATDPSGSCILGCYDGSILQNDLFYSDQELQGAPAPTIGGGWPGIVAALLGAGVMAHRRRFPRRTSGSIA